MSFNAPPQAGPPAPAIDPVQALQEVFTLPADSPAQLLKLQTIRTSLEASPGPLTALLPPLLGGVVPNPDSAFKRWIIDMLGFVLGQSTLSVDAKAQLAMGCLDSMARLLMDPSWTIRKGITVAWCCAYGHIFRHLCAIRNASGQWEVVQRCKKMILGLLDNVGSTPGQVVSGFKFAQRVVLVQSRGANDPRLQNKADPNLNMCPPDHPYMNARELEAEAAGLMQKMLNTLYQSQTPEVISSLMNLTIPFVKTRNDLVQPVLQALTSWTPAHISSLAASEIRSVEKALRIVLMHIMRHGLGSLQLRGDVNEALLSQMTRMDQAAREEHARRQERKRTLPEGPADAQGNGKKPRTEPAKLADFNFRELPHAIVTELVVANLLAVSQARLDSVVAAYRQVHVTAVAPPTTVAEAASSSQPAVVVKDEPIDPLNMELEEELEYEPEKLNSNLEVDDAEAEADEAVVALPHIDFELPPAKHLSREERTQVIKSTIDRIRLSGEPYLDTSPPDDPEKQRSVKGLPPGEAWVLFLVRLATRGPPGSNVRPILCDYVTLDFQSRHRLATIWMNEEWYNDTVRRELNSSWEPQYDVWIQAVLSAPDIKLDAKDKAYTRFILDLPAFPPNLLSLLRDRCIDSETMPVGFNTLRELVTLRPPIRTQAMKVLLDLTTHSDKVIRGAAIITVRRWVPDQQPMDHLVRMFARGMLRRLATKPDPPVVDTEMADADAEGSEEQSSLHKEEETEEPSISSYLPDELVLPAEKPVILQHIELLLGLAVKAPEFLNQIFESYGRMDESVQESLQTLLVPLIKTLGPTNPKLLELLQSFPTQAESLALRILTILTDHARPTPQIVSIVKQLLTERELDSKFLIIIIGEMDKADIVKHLPQIVTMLTGKAEDRDQVRKVFSNIVTEGPTGASSNMPRVRHSERLAPAELLVLLHEQEKEIGLKGAMEAIDICFSMPDIFRSETLAVVMQQIVDAPTLPVLFMRTVIRAVQTYKGLISFVSTTLFSRLIVKKIWTNGQLWEGFIRCAKITAPSSFGALLQLQREQLREVVDKQPSLKNGLRDYVIKKERNKPKLQSFLETLGDGDVTMDPPATNDTPPIPPLPSDTSPIA